VKPWKHTDEIGNVIKGYSLQFGHGSEAVETRKKPTPYKPADFLQFGHGSEAVETPQTLG